MELMIRRLGFVVGTVFFALLGICMVFWVTQANAANMAKPGAPENPLNEYPSTWVLVVNNTGTLHTVNTASDIVYGPFLTHEMGSEGGGLFDVAVTPNGKTALVSNFGDAMISFVNISNPMNPSLMATMTVWITHTVIGDPLDPADDYTVTGKMFAEDIAITQDGKFALVTDGGYSSYIVVFDIAAQKEVTSTNLVGKFPNGVTVAPDGTVIVPDYYSGALHSFLLDDAGYLTYGGTVTFTINENTSEISPTSVMTVTDPWVLPKPMNVEVAPDGKTVIACVSGYFTASLEGGGVLFPASIIPAYRIVEPGVLALSDVITGISVGDYQSVAFSAVGDKAYLFGNYMGLNFRPSHLTVLDITAPGKISLYNEAAAEIPRYGNSELFGVDTIAVINNKAYIGHETISQLTDTLRSSVHVIDLNSFSVTTLTLQGLPPESATSVGVAAVPYFTYVPFLIQQ